jgi:hypothetical protein
MGEGALVFFYLKWIPSGMFLPVVWIMLLTFSAYLLTHGVLQFMQFMKFKETPIRFKLPQWAKDPYFYMLAGIFVLAMDFWAWNSSHPMVMGFPLWLGYFVLLSAIQTGVMVVWVKKTEIKTNVELSTYSKTSRN